MECWRGISVQLSGRVLAGDSVQGSGGVLEGDNGTAQRSQSCKPGLDSRSWQVLVLIVSSPLSNNNSKQRQASL